MAGARPTRVSPTKLEAWGPDGADPIAGHVGLDLSLDVGEQRWQSLIPFPIEVQWLVAERQPRVGLTLRVPS